MAHDDTQGEPRRASRRALVLGGMAAAAAAVLTDDAPAAADGTGLLIGQANPATNPTTLTASNATYAFTAVATTAYGFGLHGVGTAYGVHGEATTYAGVFGDGSGGATGVSGLARGASGRRYGVAGSAESAQGVGVAGYAPAIGVFGNAAPINVDGPPDGMIGVCGRSNSVGGLGGWFSGTRAALRLVPAATAGAPTTTTHEIGDLVVDSAGRVFVCTAAGTPGTWNELGAAPPVTPAPTLRPTLQLLPVPERFIDTRDGTGGLAGTVAAGTTRGFSLTGRKGLSGDPARQVPDSAIYVAGNLAVLGAASASVGSFMTLWASGPRPPVASINFGPAGVQGVVANSVLVNLADQGDGHRGFQLFNNAACDYVFDVTGYYVMT